MTKLYEAVTSSHVATSFSSFQLNLKCYYIGNALFDKHVKVDILVSTLNTEYKGQGEARALSLLAPVVSLASEKNAWHYLVSK